MRRMEGVYLILMFLAVLLGMSIFMQTIGSGQDSILPEEYMELIEDIPPSEAIIPENVWMYTPDPIVLAYQVHYEYQVFWANCEATCDRVTDQLNDLGQDGWRLHTMLATGMPGQLIVVSEREARY